MVCPKTNVFAVRAVEMEPDLDSIVDSAVPAS
jgi:hypothetical protein